MHRFSAGPAVPALLPAFLLVCLAGCGDASADDDPEADLVGWVPELELKIGAADGPGPLLTRISAVRIAPGGRLVVAQPQEREVLVFDREGELLATAGGPGEGPGEIASLSGLGIDGDSIFVSDSGRRGLHFFGLDGEFLLLREWMLAGEPEFGAEGAMSFPAPPQVLLDDGSALVRPNYGYAFPQEDSGSERYRWPLLRIDETGQPLDTLGHFELGLAWTRLAALSGTAPLWAPFSDHSLVELAPDGSGAAFVLREIATNGSTGTFTVGRVSPRGDTVALASFAYRPIPLSDERLRRHAEGVVERRAEEADPPPSAADVERALGRGGLLPAFLPPVTRLVPTSDGSVWLQREDTGDDSVAWDVLDPDLEGRRRVVFPAGFRVFDAVGDVVVGEELDAFDVPSVVRYRLTPGPG